MALYVNGKKINEIMVQGKSIGFGYSNGKLVFQKKKPEPITGKHIFNFTPSSVTGFNLVLSIGSQSQSPMNNTNESLVVEGPLGDKVSWRVLSLDSRFTCEPMSGEFTLSETQGVTTFTVTQVKANVTINPTPADATVSIDGIYTNSKVVDIPTTIRYAVSKEGYIGESANVTITADTVINVSLVKEEEVTINLSYSPAISANIVSNNNAVTVTRTGGDTSGATLKAAKGTTARITVTPIVSGYKSNYVDVTFDTNKSVSVTLSSTVTYRCYGGKAPEMSKGKWYQTGPYIYIYVPSNATKGTYVYGPASKYLQNYGIGLETCTFAVSSSSELAAPVFLLSSITGTGSPGNFAVYSITDSTLVTKSERAMNLSNPAVTLSRRTDLDLTS